MVALKEEELRKLREATQLLIGARAALEGVLQDFDGNFKHIIGEMDRNGAGSGST